MLNEANRLFPNNKYKGFAPAWIISGISSFAGFGVGLRILFLN